MTKQYRMLFLLLSLTIVAALSNIQAQQTEDTTSTCSQLVELALQEVGNNCSAMDRNSTCYGYDEVSASFASQVPDGFFSQPADRAGLTELLSIQTAPLDEIAGRWGVALMNVQANVPNTLPGQAVTFILMGDTRVENAVDPASAAGTVQPVDIMVVPDANARLRSAAHINSNEIVTVPAGTVLKADGISADGQWVHVSVNDRSGWIYKDLVADMSLTAGLTVMSESAKTPMQAFYFTSGVGTIECADAPNVLFIQGPKGVKVDLSVNGADIQIGSTIVLQSKSASYGEFSSDPELAEIYSTTLTFKDIPADTTCEQTSMIMLEGQAIMNDAVSLLPIGHAIDSISCKDDSGQELLTTPWRGLRRLSQEELKQYAVIEKVPANVLSYPVHIPSDTEINQELARIFPDKPVVTEEATIEATETATPEIFEPPQPTPESTEDF